MLKLINSDKPNWARDKLDDAIVNFAEVSLVIFKSKNASTIICSYISTTKSCPL